MFGGVAQKTYVQANSDTIANYTEGSISDLKTLKTEARCCIPRGCRNQRQKMLVGHVVGMHSDPDMDGHRAIFRGHNQGESWSFKNKCMNLESCDCLEV